MDLMFANMLSSGLCVPIHQPQTHLCNLGCNLSERRWAAESPPHCLAGPDEISKHTAVQANALASPQQTQVARVCQSISHGYMKGYVVSYLVILRICGVICLI